MPTAAHIPVGHTHRRRARLIPRLRVHLHVLRLDSRLAAGADPSEDDELALRAEQLVDPGNRRQLADSLDRLLERAERTSMAQTISTRIPFRGDRVRAMRSQFSEIAERLRADAPPPLEGVARAHLLLEDGTGPLYVGSNRLRRAVDATLVALRGAR